MGSTTWAALASKAAEAPDAGSYEPLPPGLYDIRVESAECRTTSTNKDMYVLTQVVTKGQYEGRKLWQNIVISPESATALSIAFRHFAALGLGGNFFAAEPDSATICAKLIDATATAQVAIRKDDASRNEVKDLKPRANDPMTATASAPATAAASPPLDPFAP